MNPIWVAFFAASSELAVVAGIKTVRFLSGVQDQLLSRMFFMGRILTKTNIRIGLLLWCGQGKRQ